MKWKTKGDPILAGMAKAAGDLVRAIRSREAPRWLTLWGSPGTGKTYLVKQVHRMFLGRAHWLDWVDLCRRFQSKDETAGRLRWACDAQILIIDDIGTKHITPGPLGLLHSRLSRWTVITTNMSRDSGRSAMSGFAPG